MRKRDVINMALDSLGIGTIDDADNNRLDITKKANRYYEPAALYVLTYDEWFEAIETTTFTSEAAITNVWNDIFEYAYLLPTDNLRILDIDLDKEAQYLVQGKYLYTNYYNSSSGFTVRYLKDIRAETDSSLLYSDMLGEVIASRLAYNLASVGDKPAFNAVFNDVLFEALKQNRMSDGYSKRHNNPYWVDVDRYRTKRRRDINR